MRVEVMQHFGLATPFNQAGYYETAHHQALMKDIQGAIHEGRLIALCGVDLLWGKRPFRGDRQHPHHGTLTAW